MRQNTTDIKIHSLIKRKRKKDLDLNPDNCDTMIKNHQKRVSNMKLKTVIIPNDIHHTQFIVSVYKDSKEIINRYLRSKKYK